MKTSLVRLVFVPLIWVAACSDSKSTTDSGVTLGDGASPGSDASANAAQVGTSGGTVTGPQGAKAEIPAGALVLPMPLSIVEMTGGTPTLPADATATAATLAFLPHGTTFAKPVTITVPFTGSSANIELLTAQPNGQWIAVPNVQIKGSFLTAEVTHYSFFVCARRGPRPDGGADAPKASDAGGDAPKVMDDAMVADGPTSTIKADTAVTGADAAPDASAEDTAPDTAVDTAPVVANCGKITCDCTYKGKKLWGRVKFVSNIEQRDFVVKETMFLTEADLKVKDTGTTLPIKCGQWQTDDLNPTLRIFKASSIDATPADFLIYYTINGDEGVAKPPQ